MSIKVISRGIGVGKVFYLKPTKGNYEKIGVDEALITYESLKYHVIESLNQMKDKADSDILDFQIAVLNDHAFEQDIKRRIKENRPIDKAFEEAMSSYIKQLLSLNDPYFKSRVSDLHDLTTRLFQNYHGTSNIKFNDAIILCVEELYPSMLFEFKQQIKGILAKKGHDLSHAAILARERNIPYLVVKDFPYEAGTKLLVNGYTSSIMVNPKVMDHKRALFEQRNEESALTYPHKPYKLYLNLSGDSKIDKTYIANSDGVGLYRSEFLYHTSHDFPSMEYQYEVYLNLAKQFYPKPVVIRTYDFSEDKSLDGLNAHRGVAAYLLSYEDAFIEQMTALLLVAEKYDNLKIMIPMVYSKSDYEVVNRIATKLKSALNLTKPLPPIGVMIETKEAFEHLSDFSKVGFISIGSNDLGSNLFGFDRTKPIDFELYVEKLIDAIYDIVSFAKDKRVPCTICGDIASHKAGFKALLGISATDFSITLPFLVEAKKIIQSK